jgi:RNA polymerase sigma-70 factor (ECF subfamily)
MSTMMAVNTNTVGTIGERFEAGLVSQLPALRRMALRLTGQVPDAEDLVQETVARALAHRAQFQPGTNLRAWLCTIQRSIFVSAYRRRRRAPMLQSLEILEDEGTLYAAYGARAAASAEQVFLHGRMDDTLVAALASLPEHYRLPVLLCDVQGLSYAEAAQAMQCALGTVMSRLHRGRARLRAALSARDREPQLLQILPAALAA